MQPLRLTALALLLLTAPMLACCDTGAGLASDDQKCHQDLDLLAIAGTDAWTVPLMPIFEAAAKRHDVPLPLLLALGYFGSAFENRGGAPAIEGGYGVMALRKSVYGADSLIRAAARAGATEDQLKLDPAANIDAAAATLAEYAAQMKIDTSTGLAAWLEPVVKYAGLDEENSRFFAMEIFEKLRAGLDQVASSGERFYFAPHDIGSVDLAAFAPAAAIATTAHRPPTRPPPARPTARPTASGNRPSPIQPSPGAGHPTAARGSRGISSTSAPMNPARRRPRSPPRPTIRLRSPREPTT